ncbi:MAG: serine/threonine-protein kinase [Bryobacteraceae bacterium]|nr:serine/threonine-protein kinase [Bryobacteraceae bacterium]
MTGDQWQRVKTAFGQALEQPPSSRVSWIETNCREDGVRDEVLSLLAAHTLDEDDFLEQPPDAGPELAAALHPDSMIGQRIGPWQLVEEIGQGGMGTVYRAVRADDEFRREVAIKIVSRGMDTDILLRRFRTERQILATLEHPCIATLLDGGSTPSGLPYFVMEFVRGVPLTQYCDRHRLGITERIQLFRKVCSAVAYAHNNLIVHRDLKPANILVTENGTPKLLDFGIARLLAGPGREGSEPTVTMLRMATPAYASPEQIRGAVAGIPSDIYSLGVILYELLTGHRPYRLPSRESGELAQVICEREPTRCSVVVGFSESMEKSGGELALVDGAEVSADRATTLEQLRRRLRGDIDNIVGMALRKEPHRRYESVELFSEDLHRHLTGLPIHARKDTFSYRAGKFVDRHRWSMFVGAFVTVLLVVMSLVAIQKAARLAYRIEEDHKLATSFLVEIHDSIAKLPGAAQARETMLKQSLRYLNGLASDAGNGSDFQTSLALAYEKFAELQIGRNGPGIGNSADAQETWNRARAIREAVANQTPGNGAAQLALARTYLLGGYIAGRASAPVDMRRSFDQKALEMAEKLIVQDPRDPDYRRLLAEAHTSVGYGLIVDEQWENVRVHMRQAMAILSEIAAEDPQDLNTRRELATIHYRLGSSYVQSGQPGHGQDELHQALELQQQLSASSPDDAVIRSQIAATRHFLGIALGALGRTQEAIENFDQAIETRLAALDADPRNSRERSMLAGNYSERGMVLITAGRLDEALASARSAVQLQEQVVAGDPKGVPIRVFMAEIESGLARVYETMAAKQPRFFRDAADWYGRSLKVWGELESEGVLRGPSIRAGIDKTRAAQQRCENAARGIL